MRTKSKRVKLVWMDSTKNVLFNFSSKFFLFVANFLFLPFSLIFAYDLSGRLPFVGMFLALCAVSAIWLTQGAEPFSGWSGKDDFAKLDESALRVLTFFRSLKAKRIIICVSLIFFVIILLTWILSSALVEHFRFISHLDLREEKFAWVGGIVVAFALSVHGTLMVIVSGYALKHYDEIQKTYEPWPVDKPYYLSFSFGKKKKKDGGEPVSAKSTETEEKGSEEQNFTFSHALYYGLVIFAVILLFTNARFILDIFTGSFGKSSYEKLAYFLLGLVLLKGADLLVKKK